MFRRKPDSDLARSLYGTIVHQARQERFYRGLGVPDTVDGRFEMLALHAFLVMRRIKDDGDIGHEAGQALLDAMFDDLDVNLREMGAGDMGVGKRVKAMVQAFYGRVAAYGSALERTDDDLSEALLRNLYRTRRTPPDEGELAALVRYVRAQARHLDTLDAASIRDHGLSFAETPE